MIVELHQQELQSSTEPSIHAEKSGDSTTENQRASMYYFGQALGNPDGFFIDFMFLRSTVCSGARVFDWPRIDNTDRVHTIIKLARSSSVLKPKGSYIKFTFEVKSSL